MQAVSHLPKGDFTAHDTICKATAKLKDTAATQFWQQVEAHKQDVLGRVSLCE